MTFPSFSYSLMEILCKELQERVLHFKVVNCLPNDLHRFFLVLRGTKHQETIFFSFTPPFIRFHLVNSSANLHDQSSHPLLSFLQGATLNQVCLLQQDRILQLTFSTTHGERRLIAEFFSKHPNYYLVQQDGKILFALHPITQTHYQLPTLPRAIVESHPLLWRNHQEVEHAYTEIETQWKFSQEKQALQTLLSKQIKNLLRKEKKLRENIEQCAQWSNIQHEGDLIKFHLGSIKKGAASIIIHDWLTDLPYEIKFDPAKTPQEEMTSRYKRARKLQAGKAPLNQQLERVQTEIHLNEEKLQTLHDLTTLKELVNFRNSLPLSFSSSVSSVSTAKPPPPIYKEYVSEHGIKIWVGKNAKMNDRLTFQLANGRDWWLHAQGCPGSHVLIRLGKDLEPDPETLKDALQLALYYSKARSQGEGEICFTQRKYVSRLGKKKPGLVQISKHQIAWIRLDPVRLQAIKDRA